MKRIFIALFVCIMFVNVVSAAESLDTDKYFLYNGFRMYDDQSTNKVSYSIKVEKNVPYKFELKYYYDDKLVETCNKDILLEGDEGFTKVTCEIQKLGDGQYTFDANLFATKEGVKQNVFNREYVYGNGKAEIDFDGQGDRTVIRITIEGEFEDIQIQNRIPKSVIENLNDGNKDSLIESDLKYEILEEDPLIAWNVEKTPTTINYTLNKKISEEQMKEFRVEMTKTKSFKALKYVMLVLILVIVALLIRPLFKKNGSKK